MAKFLSPQPFDLPALRVADLAGILCARAGAPLNPLPDEGFFIPTSSGKGALCLALQDLRATNSIRNKNDNVLVPKWLGYAVYSAMHPHAFPTLSPEGDIAAMVVYHQYGFAQDMEAIGAFASDRGIPVIEDCAHALAGDYRGRRLGTFGDYAVFSYSKFFPCIMAGGLWIRDAESYERIVAAMTENHKAYLQAWSLTVRLLHDLAADGSPGLLNRMLETSYAVYDRHPRINALVVRLLRHQLARPVMQKRRDNWHVLTQALADTDMVAGLEETATPYCVPVKIPDHRRDQALTAVRARGINAGYYKFDVARNLLRPDFQDRLLVPVHQGLEAPAMMQIGEDLKRAVADDGGRP
ncbi:MAG: DegT/DnrJ/EryC1/StrS family aminotransferase [Rhodospirillales bacterium]|nr:DegT/DnrJ/EryC1/StrS family aminotransferase [Rhodospirillales bacterium]